MTIALNAETQNVFTLFHSLCHDVIPNNATRVIFIPVIHVQITSENRLCIFMWAQLASTCVCFFES